MAERPIFLPKPEQYSYVKEVLIEFQWFPGFALSQTQKSIRSLHDAAQKQGFFPILEISTKSEKSLGVLLSAFNLELSATEHLTISVESAFQGSKVFKYGGPYKDLYTKSGKEAKTDPRIKNSGPLVGFDFFGEKFTLEPKTAFYDWLYLRALCTHKNLSTSIMVYKGFSDIAFNPEKSINCQARSAALFVALENAGINIKKIIDDRDYYKDFISDKKSNNPSNQLTFPWK
jgi:hypothetical protein